MTQAVGSSLAWALLHKDLCFSSSHKKLMLGVTQMSIYADTGGQADVNARLGESTEKLPEI